jgi:hypothetical protein
MIKFIRPNKDTTIYQAFPNNNSGLDEIIEIGKTVDPLLNTPSYVSASARGLLYFPLPTTQSVSTSSSYYLTLKLANASNIKRTQEVLVYSISNSWDEGSGYFYQQVQNSNDGATWNQSQSNMSWSLAGGDFITGSTSASLHLVTYPMRDLIINVTDILRPIVNGSLQNTFHGLMVKFPDADEIDPNNTGNIKVFSSQTHTIHGPTLAIEWESQQFSTGSLKPIPSTLDVKVVASNLQSQYAHNDIQRINFVVRDPYPLRSFDSTLRYKNKYYLPTRTHYSITDVQANTEIIRFIDLGLVECDSNGSYMILDTSPLYSKRQYSIKLRVASGSFVKTIDPDIQFSIL